MKKKINEVVQRRKVFRNSFKSRIAKEVIILKIKKAELVHKENMEPVMRVFRMIKIFFTTISNREPYQARS